MDRIESTLENPIRFLKRVVTSDGEEYLRFLFENPIEPNTWLIKDGSILDCIRILAWNDDRGILLDPKTNEREYELTFDQYVHEEFLNQIRISQILIFEKSKLNGFDQDLKLYTSLLYDLIDLHNTVDKSFELEFEDELNYAIDQIIKYALRKFKRIYPDIPAYRLAKKHFTRDRNSNITGFKLKAQRRNFPRPAFVQRLLDQSFVTRTKTKYITQFLQGQIPDKKINWHKEPHELKYFIDCLCNTDILESMPAQQWKYLTQIFTCQETELQKGWHRNHKLKNPSKKQSIDELCGMLLPQI
ncbi:hypothetical protein AQPE_2000 [Aquipluma nitroreducens]|uniref:Uncharacterized protein n=1 Tax=Aquipluma nitroreducens TaxID=2010828 RepID=A0A5K7S8G2_9BACT|nr:hypothetical protein [Aquipluma nitroreducens]BBE17841.1 hypothetical protein AQPE_2000 [Aquipluma nitroreducens]